MSIGDAASARAQAEIARDAGAQLGFNVRSAAAVPPEANPHGCDSQPSYVEVRYRGAASDMSLPFRLTGIPNNATVQVSAVRGESRLGAPSGRHVTNSSPHRAAPGNSAGSKAAVRVLLQTPGGRRLLASFPARTTLQQILQHWQQDGSIPATVHEVWMERIVLRGRWLMTARPAQPTHPTHPTHLAHPPRPPNPLRQPTFVFTRSKFTGPELGRSLSGALAHGVDLPFRLARTST